MIFTSYFGYLKNLPKNMIPVSICGKPPDWYNGLQYKKLAPKYSFFIEWKKNHNNEYYISCFKKEVLDILSIDNVLLDLQNKIPEELREKRELQIWNSINLHIALICYEKPEDFCHRHLVSKWLNENSYFCEEYKRRI